MNMILRRYALVPVCLMWLGALIAALAAAWLRDIDWMSLLPIAGIAAAPAILALILSPVIHKEWAQILVILGWLALAVIAVLAISFVPMAILFMCAPAAAALFEREKVVEAMVMAAILAAILFYAGQQGIIPDGLTNSQSKNWGQQLGIFATLAFLVGSLMMAAYSRGEISVNDIKAVNAMPPPNITETIVDVDIVPGNFFILNEQNQVLRVNQNARKNFYLYEHGGSEFTTMLQMDNIRTNSVSELIAQARETNAEQTSNLFMGANTATPTYLRLIVRPLKDGRVTLSLYDLNDSYEEISQLQQDNAKVQQDSEHKSLFFAGVSHELRTPLNAIIGFSDMMRSRLFGPLPNKYAEYADMIHDSGQHMLDLIGDVLDMSKVDAGKYELKYDSFQAEDIIRSSLKMVQPTADAGEVVLQSDMMNGEDMLITADRRALRQILLNLLSNAVKFSPKGGVVRAQAKPIGDKLRISVRDQGPGMSPDLVEQIGQPYIASDSQNISAARGSGLGLSLVKSLVELHKGQMKIESEIGSGTIIHIDLPMDPFA